MRRRDVLGLGLGALAAAGAPTRWAMAGQTSLTVVSEAGPNSFDPIGVGVNRNSIQITWNVYDRLLRFGTKQGPGGALVCDYFALEGEAA